jgi:large subunit ribosomal protein L21
LATKAAARLFSTSIIEHPYSLNDEPLGEPNKDDRFAIIQFSGTQYKVTYDDVLVADKQNDVDIGEMVELDRVMLLGSKRTTILGRPLVEGAKVMCEVEEIAKDKKVLTFKKRRRKNSQRLRGFRRQVTTLRVVDIKTSDEHDAIL